MKTIVPENKLPLLRVAELSTAHLHPRDLVLIQAAVAPGVSFVGAFGALIYLPPEDDMEGRLAAGFSEAFIHLLSVAASQGFTHIRFDSDAPIVSGLTLYD